MTLVIGKIPLKGLAFAFDRRQRKKMYNIIRLEVEKLMPIRYMDIELEQTGEKRRLVIEQEPRMYGAAREQIRKLTREELEAIRVKAGIA